MANEFKHDNVGNELSKAEWEAVGTHIFDSQATGDILYASSNTQLSRLGKGSDGQALILSSGVPAWSSAPTLIAPDISGTVTATSALTLPSFTLMAGGTATIPIDGAIELVAHTGNCLLRGGTTDRLIYELIIQPASGDEMGAANAVPSGTEDTSSFTCINSSDLDNLGYAEFYIDGLLAGIFASKLGTGTKPTSFRFNIDVVSNYDRDYSLGTDAIRWLNAYAEHHQLTQALDDDHTWSGICAPMTAGATLDVGQAIYVGGDSKMEKALATGTATMPAMALATGSIAEDASGSFLLQGFLRDDTWDWIPGNLLYICPGTAGILTQAAPAGSGEQVQVVGVAITADIIHFNPSYELVEIS